MILGHSGAIEVKQWVPNPEARASLILELRVTNSNAGGP